MLTIHSGARVLFDGDSVTDCGRDRQDRHSLSGYNDKIARNAQNAGVEFFNRCISGDRSKDLLARIESDLRDTKPDVVSILIGINDTWRRYDENDPTTALAYEQNMRGILKTVRAFGAKIILLEPFLLPTLERFQTVSYTHLRDARLHARDPLGGLCGYDRDLRELFRRGVFVKTAVGIYERAVLAVLVAALGRHHQKITGNQRNAGRRLHDLQTGTQRIRRRMTRARNCLLYTSRCV